MARRSRERWFEPVKKGSYRVMPSYTRAVTLLVALALTLTACANPEAQATTSQTDPPPAATAAPTVVPTSAPMLTPPPTEVPRLAADVRVAGVDVGGLEPEQARRKLDEALAPLLRSLDVQAGDQQLTLGAEEIDLRLPIDEMIAAAQSAGPGGRVALQILYDEARLRAALEGLAGQVARPPAISVISATETISRSFAVSGGERLNVDAAARQIDERLRSLGGPRRVTLALEPDTGPAARPTPEQLQQQIEAMAERWKGVAGIYVYDFASDQVVASLNQDTVFSGASVMKVPILLHSYIKLPTFTDKQETWLKKMIVESDNLAANNMLAASGGGSGTEAALEGVLSMTEMLKSLGLQHTYQYTPYEAKDYLNLRNIKTRSGPKREGPSPYTDPDPKLRTTPAEMSRIFLLIHKCAHGEGELLDRFGTSLTAARCQEMLDRLETNGDHSRMVAGLPDGTHVAHKSGWIEDMQADVGIVRSPGGDFLLAVYVYREIVPGKNYLSDEVAAPWIAGFAGLVYSYFNPIRK